MKFSLNKIFGKSDKENAKENEQEIDSTEAIINDIENTPFGISNSNVLYVGFNELGGYHFMQTVIVGRFHIKTKKGAQLQCFGKDFELVLNSDMEELESDVSNVSYRSITPIDFQIESDDIAKINPSNIERLVLSTKKKTVEFTIYEVESIN